MSLVVDIDSMAMIDVRMTPGYVKSIVNAALRNNDSTRELVCLPVIDERRRLRRNHCIEKKKKEDRGRHLAITLSYIISSNE
jgi:hypothetical protein